MRMKVPNMANPKAKATVCEVQTARRRNSRTSTSGSATLSSMRTNATSAPAPRISSPTGDAAALRPEFVTINTDRQWHDGAGGPLQYAGNKRTWWNLWARRSGCCSPFPDLQGRGATRPPHHNLFRVGETARPCTALHCSTYPCRLVTSSALKLESMERGCPLWATPRQTEAPARACAQAAMTMYGNASTATQRQRRSGPWGRAGPTPNQNSPSTSRSPKRLNTLQKHLQTKTLTTALRRRRSTRKKAAGKVADAGEVHSDTPIVAVKTKAPADESAGASGMAAGLAGKFLTSWSCLA